MSGPRIGSLCSGYGGLDMAVLNVFGGEIAWFSEYDKAPSKILAHHWPSVPNLGDMTIVDWPAVEPIDILTAGYPCQPFSVAGKRKGANDERHLWPYVIDAIRALRPRIVVLENVRGHLTLGFGRVLGDLAEAGYDTQWVCLPASDAGAPHRRERIFILATDTQSSARGIGDGTDVSAWGSTIGRQPNSRASSPAKSTDNGREWGGHARHGWDGPEDASEASTHPSSHGRSEHPELDGETLEPELSTPFGEHVDGCTAALLGTPTTRDSDYSGLEGRTIPSQRLGERLAGSDDLGANAWGRFGAAIERWAQVLGRRAPSPTLADGKNESHRLSALAVEFMMGLPLGHVTAPEIGLTRTEKFKALGNGVVPQQAELAIRTLVTA